MAVNANLFAVSKSHLDGNLYVQIFWFCKFLLYEFCCIMLMQLSFIGKPSSHRVWSHAFLLLKP